MNRRELLAGGVAAAAATVLPVLPAVAARDEIQAINQDVIRTIFRDTVTIYFERDTDWEMVEPIYRISKYRMWHVLNPNVKYIIEMDKLAKVWGHPVHEDMGTPYLVMKNTEWDEIRKLACRCYTMRDIMIMREKIDDLYWYQMHYELQQTFT